MAMTAPLLRLSAAVRGGDLMVWEDTIRTFQHREGWKTLTTYRLGVVDAVTRTGRPRRILDCYGRLAWSASWREPPFRYWAVRRQAVDVQRLLEAERTRPGRDGGSFPTLDAASRRLSQFAAEPHPDR